MYKTEDGKINIDVVLKDETIWLTQKSMAELFDVQRPAITKHLKNIFEDGELEKNQVCSNLEQSEASITNLFNCFVIKLLLI